MNFAGFVRTHEPERNCVHLNDPVSQRIKLQTRKINMIMVKYSISISSFYIDIETVDFYVHFYGEFKDEKIRRRRVMLSYDAQTSTVCEIGQR